ncbi:MAG: helix-turn-helix domain-containing protein [Bacilli bacterium]|nr:helix-turn-helix domain-containing protein [Bacilli bacterium]
MANMTIGPKIKKLRQQKGLTQEQLAEALGYSGKSVISHIEKGDADMTYEKILFLLRKFDLDANSLFDGEIKKRKRKRRKARARKVQPEVEEANENIKRVAIYIHGLHGSAKEADFYKFLKGYDVKGLEYSQEGKPWELKEPIQNEFKKLTKGYDEVIVIANSIGAFYAYEYLSSYKIKKAFFISPIVSMFQQIVDLMAMYGIKDKELERKKFITLEDGNVLSYDFYQHVSTDDDNWKVPTEILYGAFDQMVYMGSMMEFLENHPQAKLTVKSESEHHFSSPEEMKFIKNWINKNLD